MGLNIEEAKIVTLSIAHLSKSTIDLIESCKGNMSNGPSIAVRDFGFIVNSNVGDSNPVLTDMLPSGDKPSLYEMCPDLVLIRAVARRAGADWINIDVDGEAYTNILPTYDGDEPTYPSDEIWDGCSLGAVEIDGSKVLRPNYESLMKLQGFYEENHEDIPKYGVQVMKEYNPHSGGPDM